MTLHYSKRLHTTPYQKYPNILFTVTVNWYPREKNSKPERHFKEKKTSSVEKDYSQSNLFGSNFFECQIEGKSEDNDLEKM